MRDWNVVITVHKRGFVPACEMLEELGPVAKTGFYNVLVMKVEDTRSFLETIHRWVAEDPYLLHIFARVVPATKTFNFQSAEEFEEKASKAVLTWVPEIAERSFHVRMHRRGFKEKLSSQVEERLLDEVLLKALNEEGKSGKIAFEDPDVIISVETVGGRAGLSLWTRDELKRYPLLGLD